MKNTKFFRCHFRQDNLSIWMATKKFEFLDFQQFLIQMRGTKIHNKISY